MTAAPPRGRGCPDCGSDRSRDIGTLPDVQHFAGRRLDTALRGGVLVRCSVCSLMFRSPSLGAEAYRQLYDNASRETWDTGPLRTDQSLVREYIEQLPAGSTVLDFGCYSGDLLRSLSDRFRKFGVEINAAAARHAAQASGATVAADLSDLPPEISFDVIVAVDVIEHLESPRALLETLASRLSPSGRIVLTTGDGAHWLWRVFGARWWYCWFPEHVAFVSRAWIAFHAARLGLETQSVSNFRYLSIGRRQWLAGVVKLLAYRTVPRWYGRVRKWRMPDAGEDFGVPGMGVSADHLMVVLARS
jgi:2-polyprenyl-3-methyl-5-hydroxy-6-metoxy-1,4-benzoquinol methylase